MTRLDVDSTLRKTGYLGLISTPKTTRLDWQNTLHVSSEGHVNMKVLSLLFTIVASASALATDDLTLRASFGDLDGRSWDIFSKLASQLSPDASIILPDNPRFQTVHQRWQGYPEAVPTYTAVVEVAVEDDVTKTVRWANKYNLPFLAVGGAHGFLTTLGRMQGGIAISFIKMKGINIYPEGDSAELQPGLTNGELIRYLWPRGKQAGEYPHQYLFHPASIMTDTHRKVIGSCLCSGIMGTMLGGGHGNLQGLYGLLADQIQEARVVLADGDLVVTSQQSNPGLFWALRGAGHNFGIVTGLKYKIYDRIPEWTVFTMVFTQDKLEQVFTLANNYLEEKDHPAELTLTYTFVRRPDLDLSSVSLTSSLRDP
jgi:FAD/FMN-containing dehydrogenase